MSMKKLMLIMVVGLLASCSNPYWNHPGVTAKVTVQRGEGYDYYYVVGDYKIDSLNCVTFDEAVTDSTTKKMKICGDYSIVQE